MTRGTNRKKQDLPDGRLMAFTVTHHDPYHEYTSTVIAVSRWDASLAVKGQVMDVAEGEELGPGKILTQSGWNLSFSKPSHTSPSPKWLEYLKNRNLNLGSEDTAITLL